MLEYVMTPKERLIECFRALADATQGGIDAIADQAELSAESLKQIYRGVRLPNGEPRGIGPKAQKALAAHYPGWDAVTDERLQRLGAKAQRVAAMMDRLPPEAQDQILWYAETFIQAPKMGEVAQSPSSKTPSSQ